MSKYPKFCVPIKVTFNDGSQEYGGVFVLQSQRVIDVLCDDRMFLPFRTINRTVLINKARLAEIALLNREEAEDKREVLPEIDLEYLKRNVW